MARHSETNTLQRNTDYMLSPIILWVAVAFIYSGSSVAQKMTQVQSAESKPEGEAVTLDCSYETTFSSYYLYWYKQLPTGDMIFIIHHRSSESKTAKSGRYSLNFQKVAKSISLTISALEMGDTAKYFCALGQHSV
ncbi:T-cell receptor alpha chain V region HPB-MLT [Fukomys damarensis]|nr:T-cell receptor alpha chain V region HPB-MLT [Fukomys damarensis]